MGAPIPTHGWGTSSTTTHSRVRAQSTGISVNAISNGVPVKTNWLLSCAKNSTSRPLMAAQLSWRKVRGQVEFPVFPSIIPPPWGGQFWLANCSLGQFETHCPHLCIALLQHHLRRLMVDWWWKQIGGRGGQATLASWFYSMKLPKDDDMCVCVLFVGLSYISKRNSMYYHNKRKKILLYIIQYLIF